MCKVGTEIVLHTFLVVCGTYFTEVWVGVVGFTSETLASEKFQFRYMERKNPSILVTC